MPGTIVPTLFVVCDGSCKSEEKAETRQHLTPTYSSVSSGGERTTFQKQHDETGWSWR